MRPPAVCEVAITGRHTWLYLGTERRGRRKIQTSVCTKCAARKEKKYRPAKGER